jgi:hypothetical protein
VDEGSFLFGRSAILEKGQVPYKGMEVTIISTIITEAMDARIW